MKKLFVFAALMFTFALCGNAYSQDLPLLGTYANDIGTVTITKANNAAANYDVIIADKSGACKISIVSATYAVTAQGKNGATFHPNTIATVESQDYPNFTLWPVDEKIEIGADAFPYDKLDPACQAFKGNLVFTRQQ